MSQHRTTSAPLSTRVPSALILTNLSEQTTEFIKNRASEDASKSRQIVTDWVKKDLGTDIFSEHPACIHKVLQAVEELDNIAAQKSIDDRKKSDVLKDRSVIVSEVVRQKLSEPVGTDLDESRTTALIETARVLVESSYRTGRANRRTIIREIIREAVRHLFVVTTSDANAVVGSPTGMTYRRIYLESLFDDIFHSQEYYSYPDELIQRLLDMKDSDAVAFQRVSEILLKDRSADRVNEVIHFAPLIADFEYLSAGAAIESLHCSPYFPDVPDLTKSDSDLRAQGLALINVIAAGIQYSEKDPGLNYLQHPLYYDGVPVMTDANLIRLVLQKPHLGERTANVIRERQTMDFGIIDEVLNSASPSLSEGAL